MKYAEPDSALMINFENKEYLKLGPVDNSEFSDMIGGILVNGERIVQTFKSGRDGLVFTNKRLIAINVQGLTGKKKAFTILPYDRIQAFEVQTPSVFDLDSELTLWFSGMGQIMFEFSTKANVTEICKSISECTLD